MKTTVLKLLFTAVVGTGLLFLANCSSQSFSQTTDNKKENPATPVEVVTVEKGSISATYSATAALEAESEAVVVAKIGGVVKEIFAEEGQQVKKDQPLAKLEDEQYKLELMQAESLLNKMSNEFKRKEALFKNKVVSKDIYEQIKFDLQTQQSTTDLAQLKYKYTTIRSPFDGVVAERLIKVGNMIQANQEAFKVTGFKSLHAVLHIPERELSKLRIDFPAKLVADAIPGVEFTGKILRISPVVNAGTGTFKVTVEVKDDSDRLKPGMFTRVSVEYDAHEETLLVPKDTILSEDATDWVFRVLDNKVTKIKVETGYKNKTHMEITSGLNSGDIIVTTGLAVLKDGAAVQVVSQ